MAETVMSDADRAAHKAVNAKKENLKDGVAASVPRGDEKDKPERVDPLAARKAMFAKSDSLREQEVDAGGILSTKPDKPSAEQIEAMKAEAAGKSTGVPIDRSRDERDPASRGAKVEAPPVASPDEYVNLDFNGTQIKVSKRDIERVGGEAAYIQKRTLDQRQLEVERDQTLLKAREKAVADREAQLEQQRRTAAGNGSPAVTPDTRSGEHRNGAGEGVEDEALAKKLASKLYSDEEGATEAILQLLRTSRKSGDTLSEDQIVDRVAAKLKATQPAPTQNTTVPANPMISALNAAINKMAVNEYPEVCNDPVARAATYARFTQMVQEPANRDRMAIDVARDACDWGREKFIQNPRQEVLESKRGLPSSATASGQLATGDAEDDLSKPADVVAMLAERRKFGRRLPE